MEILSHELSNLAATQGYLMCWTAARRLLLSSLDYRM